MEYLGKVLDLKKNIVDGYHTFNSVVVDPTLQTVHLLSQETYSQKSPAYVRQDVVKIIEKAADNHSEWPLVLLDPEKNIIGEATQKLVRSNQAVNSVLIAKKHIKTGSETLKKDVKNRTVCHVLDREYDNEDIFRHISGLKDSFVIRVKLNRLSNERVVVYTKKNKESKQIKFVKLADKRFENGHVFEADKVCLRGKFYDRLHYTVGFEPFILSGRTYHVVRIEIKNRGENIFKEPMMLITNEAIGSNGQAMEVYKSYILRFKIETVFKFLKQNLGWETFQIRDFNSIANLLALVFFLAGYFQELEDELKKHPMSEFICKLALSKGKITMFFLLKGIEKLVAQQEVKKWMEEENITQEQIDQMVKDHFS